MNTKAQLDYPIITWIVIVFGLLILAPVMLKVFNSFHDTMGSQLGNLTGQQGAIAQRNFDAVIVPTINFWDKLIIASFVLATLLLFISAFLIDTSPVWVVLYVLISFFVILFAPDMVASLDNLYNNAAFVTETNSLTFLNSLRANFAVYLVGIMVMTGIIIYGKIFMFGGNNRRR